MKNIKLAVIFDLDGTLADITNRRNALALAQGNWDIFFSSMDRDPPKTPIVNLYHILAASQKYTMIIVTGRPERYRNITTDWLNSKEIDYNYLFMRKDNDRRPDNLIKKEILEKIKSEGFYIDFAVDDRNSVVGMWRENGVTCLQCAEGDF